MMKDLFCPYCGIGIDHYQMVKRKCNSCLHEWDIFHVTPINDEKPHTESYKCRCEPVIRQDGQNMICIHNSFDGREGTEWANEILNQ